jgi:ABC-type Fe3+ transport system substrate-binding protein
METAMRLVSFVFAFFVFAAGAAPPAHAQVSPDVVAAAKKEGRVSFYTPLIADQVVRPLAAAFKAKYDIAVDFTRLDSNLVILKILQEYRAGRGTADVFTASLGIEELIAAGALRQFHAESATPLPAQFKDSHGFWVANRIYILGPAINTNLVAAGDRPKGFDDLLLPKWKGKIAWRPNNLTGAPGFIGNVLLSMGEEKGMAYLKKFAGQNPVALQVSDRAVLDQVVAGEYPLALSITNHNVGISRKEGAPVAWLPFEPAMVLTEQMGLTKLGPHPNAALLFVEFALSREGQQVFQKAGYVPSRPDVPPLDPELSPATGHFKANIVSPETVVKNRRHWDEVYRQLFR